MRRTVFKTWLKSKPGFINVGHTNPIRLFSLKGWTLKARFHGPAELCGTFEHMVVCPTLFILFQCSAPPQTQVLFSGHRGRVYQRSSSFPGLKTLIGAICCNKNPLCRSRRKGSAAVSENHGYAQEKQDS